MTVNTAKRIRDLIDGRTDEKYHLRCYRNGEVWVFPRSERHRLELKAILEDAGLTCRCTGEPGTSGEWIIEVTEAAS
jgi:hypothetical protein